METNSSSSSSSIHKTDGRQWHRCTKVRRDEAQQRVAVGDEVVTAAGVLLVCYRQPL
jgi:hypothetical protein